MDATGPRSRARLLALALFAGTAGPAAADPGTLVLELDAVSGLDSVEHAPNLGGGRLAEPERRQRYAGATVGARWAPVARLALRGSLSRRRLTLLRDAHEVDGWSVGAELGLSAPGSRARLALDLGASGNLDPSLDKNSWTRIDGAVLTGTRVTSARDATLRADLVATLEAGPRTRLVGLAGAGRTRTGHGAVEGEGRDANGCAHRFALEGGGGRLEQLGPCGRVLALSQDYPDERAVDERFGLAPSRDLAWSAAWWRAGAALEHRRGRLGLELGVRYRRWLDDHFARASGDGGPGRIRATRTAWAGATWRATPSLALALGAAWRTAPLLNEVPLLYNALSAERYHTEAVTFSLGAELRFGR